ncbi:PAS domain-containing protein [Patulibacter sp.]|uniref:PAS domain-containing protein n=1 Tax=Patulibacter sp. TaxID=1912859 RepID=UPI002720DAFB|nr:PAS domain-containing protein [Patulibacter sp.]MDO9407726.1 PAS domain-containing protein [Patulibacter sp.]
MLRHVIEVELEFALQSVFTARQDLSELTGTSADRGVLRGAVTTLETVTGTLRVLLAVLRAFGPAAHDGGGLFDRASDAFAIVHPDGQVLYMNAAVTRVVGRDHRDVAETPFGERTWTDRQQMRRHLAAAYADGLHEDVFDVVRGDGVPITMRLHTRRLDADGQAVLLMNHVAG